MKILLLVFLAGLCGVGVAAWEYRDYLPGMRVSERRPYFNIFMKTEPAFGPPRFDVGCRKNESTLIDPFMKNYTLTKPEYELQSPVEEGFCFAT